MRCIPYTENKMQISHEEARRLIHFKADNGLNSLHEEALDSHLQVCVECKKYSEMIKDTEVVLQQTLRKHWNIHPLPLQVDAIYARISSGGIGSIILAIRKTAIGIAVATFVLFIWQSMNIRELSSQQTPQGMVLLAPTPLTHTATDALQSECNEIRYIVQPGDTLDGIARQFSITRESILRANRITVETLTPSRELILPICTLPPTQTTHPPTFTITPVFESISTTPG